MKKKTNSCGSTAAHSGAASVMTSHSPNIAVCFRKIVIAMLLLVPSYVADAQTLEKVRIGISDVSFTFLPHLIAKDTGIFQRRGLQAEIIFIGGPVGTAALAAGELDYSASTDSGIPAAVQGVPIKAVLFAMKGPPFYLISQPGLKKINELVGKKVGLSRLGTSPYFASRRIFKKFNVDVEQITYIQAGSNTNRVIALTNGSLDASMLSLPTARIMIDKGFTELASPRDIGLVPHAGLIARTAIIEKNRDQVKKMIASLIDAMEYLANNKARAVDYIANKWKLNRELSEELLVRDLLPMLTMDGRMARERVQEQLDTEYQNKLITRRAQASEVMDLTMLEEVLAKK
jgi:ABC-type nitrate/sulfonate/bicarbonate transport system substrate-binding protein